MRNGKRKIISSRGERSFVERGIASTKDIITTGDRGDRCCLSDLYEEIGGN